MKNLITLFLITVFLLFSCGSGITERSSDIEAPTSSLSPEYMEESYDESAKQSREAMEAPAPGESSSEPVTIQQKIIKEAWLNIQVDDYDKSIRQVKKVVASRKAYISKEGEFRSDYSIGNRLTIRVPNEKLDTLIADLELIADLVTSKNVEAKDVTEEYIDIDARLQTRKEVEKRYIQLLDKAYSIKDIIEVERELKNIREEIESAEGRLKYLDNMAKHSTIYLEINEEMPPVTNFRFFDKVIEGLGVGWKILLNIVLAIVYLWPLELIGLVTWWLIRRRIRKKRMAKGKVE